MCLFDCGWRNSCGCGRRRRRRHDDCGCRRDRCRDGRRGRRDYWDDDYFGLGWWF